MDLIFHAQFVASKVGKTGLSGTNMVQVYRTTRSDGTTSQVVTNGTATETAKGVYRYRLANADLTLYDYVSVFVTADSTVDQQEVPAAWSQYAGEAVLASSEWSRLLCGTLGAQRVYFVNPQSTDDAGDGLYPAAGSGAAGEHAAKKTLAGAIAAANSASQDAMAVVLLEGEHVIDADLDASAVGASALENRGLLVVGLGRGRTTVTLSGDPAPVVTLSNRWRLRDLTWAGDLTLGDHCSLIRCDVTGAVTAGSGLHSEDTLTATQAGYVNASIDSRSTYAGGDTAGTTTLLARLTADRAGYLDKLNTGVTLTVAAQNALVAAIEVEMIDDGTGGQFMAAIANKLIATFDLEELNLAAIAAAVLSALGTAGNLDQQLTDLSAAIVNQGESLSGIVSNVGQIASETAAMLLVTEKLDTMLVQDGAVWQYTAGALELAAGGGMDAAQTRAALGMAAANLDVQLAALAISAGSGGHAITVTVDDGASGLQGAKVTIRSGVTVLVQTTGANGQCPEAFGLDAGTYAVVITKAGYSFAPTTITVSATAAVTYSMTAVAIAPPAAAGQCTGYLVMYDEHGAALAGGTLEMRIKTGPGTAGASLPRSWSATPESDADGLLQVMLVQGAVYEFRRDKGKAVEVTVGTEGTQGLPEILGRYQA